ncbi:hypothetical protein E4U54_000852 [Claviceps lovelessii]|nr:hypothetical protein E4U54_000852 [Claviceps lovelessii]
MKKLVWKRWRNIIGKANPFVLIRQDAKRRHRGPFAAATSVWDDNGDRRFDVGFSADGIQCLSSGLEAGDEQKAATAEGFLREQPNNI